MSGTSTRAQNSIYKSILASVVEMDQELRDLSFSLGYPFDVGNEKLPGPLPPLPGWMLDTPMYSKLPMVPAPKGKIVLFTTGLCKKLHQTPDDLDFDPVAAGLGCEYKSLHDPHLQSHYTRHVTYDRLVRSGHITPDGMVKCTLKEFNDYHQYLKSVRLEKITQERKRTLFDEQERLSHKRRQSIRKDVSERDKLIKESLIKQKKVRDKERKKLSRKLQSDYRKTMIRLLEERRKKTALQQSRRKASEEKHLTIRTNLEVEDKMKKTLIKTKRTAEEARRGDQLKVLRKIEKEERERKLEDQWNRRELARAKRLMREAQSLAQRKDEMYQKVEIREEKVAEHREKQQDMFTQIRDDRQKSAVNNEVYIAERLEKKLDGLCRKYSAGPKRGRRRFPPINPKLTTNMTTWNIQEKQNQQRQENSSDTGSTDKLPPILSSDEAGVDRKRGGPPSMVIYDASSLPFVQSSDFSKDIITIMEESEPQNEVVSMGDAPVSLPEVLDSFTLVARQLVSTVFKELQDDPEFEDVEWEEGDDGAWKTDEQIRPAGLERSDSPEVYVDAAEVSPHASLMVANALKNAMVQLEESQPTLVKETMIKERARSIVSSVIDGALQILLPSSCAALMANQRPSSAAQAESIVSCAIQGAVTHLQSTTDCVLEGTKEPGQRSIEVDERLDGGSMNTVILSSIIDIFQEPPDGTPSITHTQASSDSESEAEEEGDAVIGIVENPILMEETMPAGGPSGDMEVDEGLHVVMHKAQDGHLIVEGAVLTAEHDSQTITERILSDITLERVSGSLSGERFPMIHVQLRLVRHIINKMAASSYGWEPIRIDKASSSRSGLAREEPPLSSSSSSEDEEELIPEDHSSIVPIYQKNLIKVGNQLIESHLAAISMKPEADGKFPTKGKCAARNSFRNIFRPDMTYCQGSAMMLRDTLVKDIKSRQTSSLPAGLDMVCEVLEQEEQDIMEKHSDEALVTVEETEGLCYLPIKKKPRPVAPAIAAPVQVHTKPSDSPLGDEAAHPAKPSEVSQSKPSEVAATKANEGPKPSLSSTDPTGCDDASPLAMEKSAKEANSDQTATEQKTEIILSSKSAVEARERALSAERRSTKREVSAQSVDASPNLAGSDEGSVTNSSSGEDSGALKRTSRKSKKVTRSSSLISGVMSRLSHVFSGTRKKSTASVPSHESSSEPASRQSSKKSVEGMTGGALSEGAQAQDGTASGEESNLNASDVHHGASVHFTSLTLDPPVKKQSIYATHRPQTPIPHLGTSIDDEEEEEEELVIEGNNVEDNVPMVTIEDPSCDAMAMEEAEDFEVKNESPPEGQTDEAVVMETDTTDEMPLRTESAPEDEATVAMATYDVASTPEEAPQKQESGQPEGDAGDCTVPVGKAEDDAEEPPAAEKELQKDASEDPTNPDTPVEHHLQIENDSNNANTESGSKPPSRLPSIRTSQLQPPLVPSQRTSALSQGREGPGHSGSRASQGSERLMPQSVQSSADRSLSGAQSMTITGRSLAPVGSKMAKSVTSTSGKEKRRSGGTIGPRAPSSGRVSRLSQHKRTGSPQKKGTVSSQSASKVRSAYGSAVGLSVTGSQILPNKPSKSISTGSRRTSRTQAGLVSATDLGSRRGSHASKAGSRGSGVVVPRPPSGVKPSGSAQSGHRAVRQPSGAQAISNPALTTAKGSSSVLVNHRSSSDRLLPRRPSLEKENRMERLSTESVSSKLSSQERVAKKKSSGTQPKKEESLQDQKPAAPMPPIKESLTPRPPSRPKQRSRPTSVAKKAAEESAPDAEQKMNGNDQAPSEE